VIDSPTSVALLFSNNLPFILTNVFVLLHIFSGEQPPALDVAFPLQRPSRDVALQLCVFAVAVLNFLVIAIDGIQDLENAACSTKPRITFPVE
jgi:hypothetical protein